MTASAANAVLPPPTVAAALDGGLGYDDLKDRDRDTFIFVGPVPKAEPGDKITIEWGGATLLTYPIKFEDLGSAILLAVSNAKIADAGEGDKTLRYIATYTQGGGQDASLPITIKVKQSIPGGPDPRPDTPFNDNLPFIELAPYPVPPDATEVTLSVPRWLDAAEGDVMTVSWNGARHYAVPLGKPPFPGRVSLTLTAAQMLEGGVGSKVPVTWNVHDVVANWSGWAPTFEANIPIEDPKGLYAPTVGDPVVGWTVLDLDKLGADDVLVFTPVYQGYAIEDEVTVFWNGTNGLGDPVAYHTDRKVVTDLNYGLAFTVPNEHATALADGNLRVTYSVLKKTGESSSSRSAYLSVTGFAKPLPAPVVVEAVGGTLDPDDTKPDAHTNVAAYPGMAKNDTVTLVWDGRAATGEPVRVTQDLPVVAVGKPLNFLTPQRDVLKFLDGNADVFYTVTPHSARASRTISVLAARESEHLSLSIRRAQAELPRPAPTVDDLVDGVLDPAVEEAVMRAPAAADIFKNDVVVYTWRGSVSTATIPVTVATNGSVPIGTVEKRYITENAGGKVTASYSFLRGGVEPGIPSLPFDFRIDGETGSSHEDFENAADAVFTVENPYWTKDYLITSLTTGTINAVPPAPPYVSGRGIGTVAADCTIAIVPLRPCRRITVGVQSALPGPITAKGHLFTDLTSPTEELDVTSQGMPGWLTLEAPPGKFIRCLELLAADVPQYFDNLQFTWITEDPTPAPAASTVTIDFENVREALAFGATAPLLLEHVVVTSLIKRQGGRRDTDSGYISKSGRSPYLTGKCAQAISGLIGISLLRPCRSIRVGYVTQSSRPPVCNVYTTASREPIPVSQPDTFGWFDFYLPADQGLIRGVSVTGSTAFSVIDNITLTYDP